MTFGQHDAKLPMSTVGFEHPAKGKQHCSMCVHFLPKHNRCELVAGIVKAQDWCTRYRAKGRETLGAK